MPMQLIDDNPSFGWRMFFGWLCCDSWFWRTDFFDLGSGIRRGCRRRLRDVGRWLSYLVWRWGLRGCEA
jgi:hypothetical protein